jgi:hypothetical protein
VRVLDGKANSTITTPANKFCTGTGGVCTISGTVPTVTGTASPLSVPLDPDGTIQSGTTLAVAATTTNVTVSDSVTVRLETLAGSTLIALTPDSSCGPTPGTVCNLWSTTITPSAGYRFAAGSQRFYFTAQQVIGNPPDIGSTAATQSTFAVTFS